MDTIPANDGDGYSTSSGLYANAADRKKHHSRIVGIASENGKAFTEVAVRYERILAELKLRAKVLDYVDVFVARKVMAQIAKENLARKNH